MDEESSSVVVEQPRYIGYLDGHRNWVTAIRTPPVESGASQTTVVSASRDKKVLVWKLDPSYSEVEEGPAGYATRSLSGHNEPIQDLALSTNAKYAVTASWDKSMRLWDLETGASLRRFMGHTSDVHSVALSPDNRQIISGGRDRTIKLWNILAECKYTLVEDQHHDWVSSIRFSPMAAGTTEALVVSCGWDKLVKVWNLDGCQLKTNLVGHRGPLYTLAISPDGSLCASGGKDGVVMLWDIHEGKHLDSIPAHTTVNCLSFSPSQYWLCAATDRGVTVWDLEEGKKVVATLKRPVFEEMPKTTTRLSRAAGVPWCIALAWSSDGRALFVGGTDHRIHVYDFSREVRT